MVIALFRKIAHRYMELVLVIIITAPTMTMIIIMMIIMLIASLDKTSSLCYHRTSPP